MFRNGGFSPRLLLSLDRIVMYSSSLPFSTSSDSSQYLGNICDWRFKGTIPHAHATHVFTTIDLKVSNMCVPCAELPLSVSLLCFPASFRVRLARSSRQFGCPSSSPLTTRVVSRAHTRAHARVPPAFRTVRRRARQELWDWRERVACALQSRDAASLSIGTAILLPAKLWLMVRHVPWGSRY